MNILPELTEDEAAALKIMAQGAALVALSFSRWEKPIKTLASRGFCEARPMLGGGVEYVATQTGREVSEAWEDMSLRDVIRVNNEVATQRHDINPAGFSEKQIRALADFYWKMTGRNPSEICPP